jgi:hypothetical protein
LKKKEITVCLKSQRLFKESAVKGVEKGGGLRTLPAQALSHSV